MCKIDAAKEAIRIAGGTQALADRLKEATGVPVSEHQVRKWRQRGVSQRWIYAVSQLTQVPLEQLADIKRGSAA